MNLLDPEAVEPVKKDLDATLAALDNMLLGRPELHRLVLAGILARGHILLEGLPGLGKTALVKAVGDVLQLDFKRVQFTPDLMPGDILGAHILQTAADGRRERVFQPGPVFCNILLADEINRASPKTQSAMLETMQERSVTLLGATRPLPDPFFVLASQNPIELEGTYPLPEAQLDRFMFNIVVDYPSKEEEMAIIRQVTAHREEKLEKIMDAEQVLALQKAVSRVPIADHVIAFANDLARATRPKSPEAPDFVKEMVAWGAGPRAGIYLVTAAQARAVLHGRSHATTADIAAVALPVLRHRVLTTFNAEASGVTSDHVINMFLDKLRPADNVEI